MSDANELAVAGGPATTEPVDTPSGNLMDPPTWEEEHAAWVRYYHARQRGEIDLDPDGQHADEWVAVYNGRVVGYGTSMTEVQNRAGAELGVHWARVVVDYLGSVW